MPDTVLSAEDYESVRRAGRLLHERDGWQREYTLNQRFEAWGDIVEQVENGYDATFLDEFPNDVGCRTWLAEAWPILTERIRSIRAGELAPLDARFRAATDERDPAGPDDRWWLHRTPRHVIQR